MAVGPFGVARVTKATTATILHLYLGDFLHRNQCLIQVGDPILVEPLSHWSL
jgi:hypothetical protein